jgi:hypothetical protein
LGNQFIRFQLKNFKNYPWMYEFYLLFEYPNFLHSLIKRFWYKPVKYKPIFLFSTVINSNFFNIISCNKRT